MKNLKKQRCLFVVEHNKSKRTDFLHTHKVGRASRAEVGVILELVGICCWVLGDTLPLGVTQHLTGLKGTKHLPPSLIPPLSFTIPPFSHPHLSIIPQALHHPSFSSLYHLSLILPKANPSYKINLACLLHEFTWTLHTAQHITVQSDTYEQILPCLQWGPEPPAPPLYSCERRARLVHSCKTLVRKNGHL